MKVYKIMTTENLRVCHAATTLAEAATMMWERDCGAIPVIDESGRIAGIITDRDICIAVATRPHRASEIRVGEVVNTSGAVHTCGMNDSLKDALKTMQQARVRRLPVVDLEGGLRGIISISDAVRHAKKSDTKEILGTLKTLSTPADLQENGDHTGHDANNDLS